MVYLCLLTPQPVTHPYFKLDYIQQHWGGQEEYLAELAEGNPDARNWQAYAREVVEQTVSDTVFAICAYTRLTSDSDAGVLAQATVPP